MVGLMKFYDRSEIRDVIAYIRLLCFPFDDSSFERVIAEPKRGIGDATIDALTNFAKKNGLSLFDALKTFPLKPKQRAAADGFIKAFDFNWHGMPPVDAVETLLDRSDYINMWKESKDPDKDDRLKNIQELKNDVIKEFDNLTDFLEQAALMTADDEKSFDPNSVAVMTIHAAKGLEFDTVFLPAWLDGIFPSQKSFNDEDIEEERRLAYVAITRAKRNCIISYSDYRTLFGEAYCERSRFIDEIDPQFLCFPHARQKQNSPNAKPRAPSVGMVGKFIQTEYGGGVVIEDKGDHYIVAVKGGIKKVASGK
jgi:DNA helicase-2/ATP-dependent DNA helicase PcrA